MSSPSYTAELRIAESSVKRACVLAEKVYHSHVQGAVTKVDKSPVTIADFGVQALVISAVAHSFPEDHIVGEEDSEILQQNDNIRASVWSVVEQTQRESSALNVDLGEIKDEGEMLTTIDKGTHQGGGVGRIWALDPIDGTSGFLRGAQYAVCLALMVDGKVVVGALGCPNLPVDPSNPSGEKGILLSAVKGGGATIRPLSSQGPGTGISMSTVTDLSQASFCEGVEKGHSSHSAQASIARNLGITAPSVQLDSQAKYASIARGVGEIYLRLPVSMEYEEKIWDHASGSLIVEEAGGTVTDIYGNDLDFTQGRTLKRNKGVVAATKALHPVVLRAVQEELAV